MSAEQRGHAGQLVGIDLKKAMLAVARSKSSTVKWVESSALGLPFIQKSFDVVLCQLGLQFFPDRLLALKEMLWCSSRRAEQCSTSTAPSKEHQRRTRSCKRSTSILERRLHELSGPSIFPSKRKMSLRGRRAGFKVVNVATIANQITFLSMLDYVRFQLTATPMAALLKEKEAAECERLILSIADDAALRLDPSVLAGSNLTFPQEAFVATASLR